MAPRSLCNSRSTVQSVSDEQVGNPSIIPAVDQGNAPLEPHVRTNVEGDAVVFGPHVLALGLGIGQLGVLGKIRCATLDENGFALPSAVPIGPPIQIPDGSPLLQQGGRLRRHPERGFPRSPGTARHGKEARQDHDPKFPHHVSSPLLTPIPPDETIRKRPCFTGDCRPVPEGYFTAKASFDPFLPVPTFRRPAAHGPGKARFRPPLYRTAPSGRGGVSVDPSGNARQEAEGSRMPIDIAKQIALYSIERLG